MENVRGASAFGHVYHLLFVYVEHVLSAIRISSAMHFNIERDMMRDNHLGNWCRAKHVVSKRFSEKKHLEYIQSIDLFISAWLARLSRVIFYKRTHKLVLTYLRWTDWSKLSELLYTYLRVIVQFVLTIQNIIEC